MQRHGLELEARIPSLGCKFGRHFSVKDKLNYNRNNCSELLYDFWTKWAISVQCIPTKILTAAFLYLPNKLSMTFYYKLLQKPKNLYKTHEVKTFARFFRQIKQTALFSIRILPISFYFFVKMMEKTQFSRIPRKIRQIDENFIGGFWKGFWFDGKTMFHCKFHTLLTKMSWK